MASPARKPCSTGIAACLEPDATLLNYGFMDAGFYTAAGLVPNVKYFHQTNVPLEEMLAEQERYLREGLCDYVITRGKQPEWIGERYELIATESSPNFWYGLGLSLSAKIAKQPLSLAKKIRKHFWPALTFAWLGRTMSN